MTKVLLVEDDNNLREIYEARLAAEGYDISTAKDGEDALAVAKQVKPDLIISDVMMPRISGFEMLDILRNTDGLKHTKIIMLTALGQGEDKSRADSLGADRYLVKSQVTLEDIVKAADELLNPSSDAEFTAPDSADIAPASQDAPSSEFITPSAPPDVAAVSHQPVNEEHPVAPVAEPMVGAYETNDNPEAVVTPVPDSGLNTNTEPVAVAEPVQPLDPSLGQPAATQPTTQPAVGQTPQPLTTPNDQTAQATVDSSEPVAVAEPVQPLSQPTPADQPLGQTFTQPTTQPTADTQAPSQPTIPIAAPATSTGVDANQNQLDQTTDNGIQTQTSSEESAAIAQQIQNFVNTDPTTPQAAAPQNIAQPSAQPTNEELIQSAVENLTSAAEAEQAPATPSEAPSGRKVIQPISDPTTESAQLDTLLAQEANLSAAPGASVAPTASPQPQVQPQQPQQPDNPVVPVVEAPAQPQAGSVFMPNQGGNANDNAL